MKEKQIKCVETGVIFPSVSMAGEMMNINKKSISMCVNGKQKKANGFTFIECCTATDEKPNNDNEKSKELLHESKSDASERDAEAELKNVIDLMVTDFIRHRSLMSKLKKNISQ